MNSPCQCYIIPGFLKTADFITRLGEKTHLQTVTQNYAQKTFYDSFDWRLYKADRLCELVRSKTQSSLLLVDIKSQRILLETTLEHVPKFAEEFRHNKWLKLLAPALEMRALQPVTTLEYILYKFNIVNKDEKIVLRLYLEAYKLIPSRIYLEPVKGYDKAVNKINDIFAELELKPASSSVLVDAMRTLGRRPGDYSSKFVVNLDPDMRSDVAVKYIFSHLLKIIKLNEQGTIADIDSEFLHDFRVSVRRTRTGLSQLKGVLPEAETAKYKEFFAWLGQITTPTRDLDSYLLKIPKYKSALPISIREDLEPFHEFLVKKQKSAQRELAKKLKSSEYVSKLIAWEDFLTSASVKKPLQPLALLPIKRLADQRIGKVFKRILRDGERISDSSPATDLHELRKTCKKLRYLLEFFQSLYPEGVFKPFLKALKNFQDILGDFQDLEIQELTLKHYSEDMMQAEIPANTFLAMGVLIQQIGQQKQKARAAFASHFKDFSNQKNREAFNTLIKSELSLSA